MKKPKLIQKTLLDSLILLTLAGSAGCAQGLRTHAADRLDTAEGQITIVETSKGKEYAIHRGLQDHLSIIAGVYAGTIKMKKQDMPGKYSFNGMPSNVYENPEAWDRTIRTADENGDQIITIQEVGNLLPKAYKTHKKNKQEKQIQEQLNELALKTCLQREKRANWDKCIRPYLHKKYKTN
ncbi:MAG: hypothetical protein U9P44_04280 [archaeon]|nr:hypothetical protein [archaeon]